MGVFENPRSLTVLADQLTAISKDIFAGTHQTRTTELGAANTDPMLLIEVGEDKGALDAIRALAERADAGPSRSGAEALVLVVKALVAPHTLDRHKIRMPLEKSREYWTDGKASTSVTAATALASIAIGDTAGAARVLRAASHRDWHIYTLDAVIKLATDQPGEAMAELESADRWCDVPRAKAVTGVLMAVAQLRMGNPHSAHERLEISLRSTAPGPVRFALRLVTADDFEVLTKDLSVYGDELAATLRSAQQDTRHLQRATKTKLTPIDGENLALLRRGYTTVQISEHRFVSVNTVRTQIRLLLRKLDVANRAEAVAKAERLGVFQTD